MLKDSSFKNLLLKKNELVDKPLFKTQLELAKTIINATNKKESPQLINKHQVYISRLFNNPKNVNEYSISLLELAIKHKQLSPNLEANILKQIKTLNIALQSMNPIGKWTISKWLEEIATVSGDRFVFMNNPFEVRWDKQSKALCNILFNNLNLLNNENNLNTSFKYNFFVSSQTYANKLWHTLHTNLIKQLNKYEIEENKWLNKLKHANNHELLKVFVCNPMLTSIHPYTIIFKNWDIDNKVGWLLHGNDKARIAKMNKHALFKREELVYNKLFYDFTNEYDIFQKREVTYKNVFL